MKQLFSILILFTFGVNAFASTLVTGTLTVTNSANITGTAAETITVNSDVRTWTNAVYDASSQVLTNGTNSVAVQRLLVHFATYPVTGLTLLSDASTYVSWRGPAVEITLSTGDWGAVTYTTNTSTTAVAVRVPFTVESAANQTNVASGLAAAINSAANTNGLNATRLLSGTVPLARLSGVTTNEIDSAFYNWIDSKTDTDEQTAAEVAFTPAGSIATNNVQDALEELDSEKQATLGFTPVNAAGDSMATLTVTGLTKTALTASRAVVSGADKSLASSATTDTELGYVSGVTSSIQTQLDGKPGWPDDTAYDAGTWDASTNAPTKNAVRDKIEAMLLGGGLGTGDIDTSEELRTILTDESGTGALLFAGGNIGEATATTPAENDNSTSVATTAYVQTEIAPLLATSWTEVTPDGTNSVINLTNALAGLAKNFYYSLSTSNHITFSNLVAGAEGTIWINAAGTPQTINFSASYDNYSTNEIAPVFSITNRAIIAYKVGWGTDATNVMLGIKRK